MKLIRLEDAPTILLWVGGLLCLQIDLVLVTLLLMCADLMPKIEGQEEVIEENPFLSGEIITHKNILQTLLYF